MTQHRTTIYFPVRMLDRLKKLVLATGISMTDHIRLAIARYLDREEAKK